MRIRALAKRLETAEDDEDQGPSVPEGKGSVDQEFFGDGLGSSGFRRFDRVVDLRDGGTDEERQDECGDVPCDPSWEWNVSTISLQV